MRHRSLIEFCTEAEIRPVPIEPVFLGFIGFEETKRPKSTSLAVINQMASLGKESTQEASSEFTTFEKDEIEFIYWTSILAATPTSFEKRISFGLIHLAGIIKEEEPISLKDLVSEIYQFNNIHELQNFWHSITNTILITL